jgi:hypothetical protein
VSTSADTVREQFIVAGTPDIIGPLLAILTADPETTVTSVSGPATQPERLSVAIAPGRAMALSAALEGLVLIEPDAPLSP